MAKNIWKPVNRHVYTPPSERPQDDAGRTAAGRRRKLRNLGFKKEADFQNKLSDLSHTAPSAGLRLLTAFLVVGEPAESDKWNFAAVLKSWGYSPRQARNRVRAINRYASA